MTANIERLSVEYMSHLDGVVNSEANPITYLGIDPGKANGLCGYDDKYYLLLMLTIHADDMIAILPKFRKVQKCIIEDYRVYAHKAKHHINSDLETSRVIGRVESWAQLTDVELIKQPALIKVTAYKWIGQEPPKKSNPKNHQMDAHAHFMYWAIKNNRINAASLVQKSSGLGT